MKHALSRERAGVNTVKAAYQCVSVPGFDAVRVTSSVKLKLGTVHCWSYPGAVLSRTDDAGTISYHCWKSTIDCEMKLGTFLRLEQTARNVQVGKIENCTLFRTKPGQWIAVNRPRKDAVLIGLLQRVRCQVTAYCEDPFVGVCVSGIRKPGKGHK